MDKNTIKLNETDIKGIVSGSIKKVLSERHFFAGTSSREQDVPAANGWVGDTQPLETIMNAAQQIMNTFKQYKKTSPEYGQNAQILQWAKSVYDGANKWINSNIY